MHGCYNLGTMYDAGKGVRQDKVKAKELYGKACDGGHIEGCFNLGLMYNKQKMYDKAIDAYRKAIKINYNQAEVHNDLAVVLWAKGMLNEAFLELETSLKINPNLSHVRTNYELAVQALGLNKK